MQAKNILVVGVRGSLLAFRRDTGERLWSTHLNSAGFVTLATDETRVYAHTKGELYCVDLFSGNAVWSDPLKGLGYGLASLAGPGVSASATSAVMERQLQEQANASDGGSA